MTQGYLLKGSLMAVSLIGKEFIMLSFALTECRRAIDNLDQVEQLAAARTQLQPHVERRELHSVFDRIRLALQTAANVSRLFWPSRNRSRGEHLRSIVGLADDHGLANRTLRNHIEHLDERLDAWTAISPKPFITVELVLYADDQRSEKQRNELMEATAIIYDERTKAVHLFGDTFLLPALRSDLEDVLIKISRSITAITKSPGWTV